MHKRRFNLSKGIMAGAFIVFALLTFYFVLLVNGLGYQKTITSTPQAAITVLAAGNIPTTDNSFLFETPTPTIDPSIGNLNGITIGVYVQISGTGGEGLRVRNSPGKSGDTEFVANESEVFKVIGGPVQADDIVWWQLSAPYDEKRQGWAAADYLSRLEDQ